nr:transmembrane protein 53 [Tanacetum cinerariifolium]
YGFILNILQGRNKLLEKIIGCVVDSGGVSKLDPKVLDIWGLFEIA